MTEQKVFLFLRGLPGTGKITVANIIQKKLGWKLFWFHDLKNAVFRIVGEHRIPRLMDELTEPVIKFILDKGHSVIYVRPATDKRSVEQVRELVETHPGNYRFVLIQLEATYEDLLKRVQQRKGDEYRINCKEDLDAYLEGRERTVFQSEHVVQTSNCTPKAVADEIVRIVKNVK